MTRDDLAALRAKYEEMRRLRLAHQAGSPEDEPALARRAMAALAARFPGALREIDELPLETIAARIDALRAAEAGAALAPWMEATHLFHAMTRGALRAKRWLAERGLRRADAVSDDVRAAFEREAAALGWADDARPWADDLARLASPPRGRVTDLVYARLATHLGVSERDARHSVFGPSRRARAAH